MNIISRLRNIFLLLMSRRYAYKFTGYIYESQNAITLLNNVREREECDVRHMYTKNTYTVITQVNGKLTGLRIEVESYFVFEAHTKAMQSILCRC